MLFEIEEKRKVDNVRKKQVSGSKREREQIYIQREDRDESERERGGEREIHKRDIREAIKKKEERNERSIF